MRTRLVYLLPSLLLGVLAITLALYGLSRTQELGASAGAVGPGTGNDVLLEESVVEGRPGYQYLMAVESVRAGEVIRREQFQVVPLDSPLADAIPATEAAFGVSTRQALQPGEVLTERAFSEATAVQAALRDGQEIAMAFPLDPVSSVGGLIAPGDRVDVLATFPSRGGEEGVTALLSTDLRVIAVQGQTRIDGVQDANDGRRNPTMVLAVPSSEAPRLALGLSEATLNFTAVDAAARQSPPVVQVARMSDIRPPTRITESEPPTTTFEPKPQGKEILLLEGSNARSVYVQ